MLCYFGLWNFPSKKLPNPKVQIKYIPNTFGSPKLAVKKSVSRTSLIQLPRPSWFPTERSPHLFLQKVLTFCCGSPCPIFSSSFVVLSSLYRFHKEICYANWHTLPALENRPSQKESSLPLTIFQGLYMLVSGRKYLNLIPPRRKNDS